MPNTPPPLLQSTHRHKTRSVAIGSVVIGGDAPIAVQSMTDTDTADIASTTRQIMALAKAGSALVRLTVNTPAAAKAVPIIRERLDAAHCTVPLIGDFHYNGHRLLVEHPACAEALAKYRINPGNVGFGQQQDTQFATFIEQALTHQRPIRIGVNWGSLDRALLARLMDENARRKTPLDTKALTREAIILSALESAQRAESLGLTPEQIVLSCKLSGVQDLIAVYRQLARRCDYALHLGLTEAGMGTKGIVASSVAIGILLEAGIGDTLRVSLTPEPGGDRTREVFVAQEILQSLELGFFAPQVTACPGCGRTHSGDFRELAAAVQQYLRERMPVWRTRHVGVERLSIAVMGCVVNGPGESRHANIGISLPGTAETPVAPVFIDGVKQHTLRGESLTEEFKGIVEDYVSNHYLRR